MKTELLKLTYDYSKRKKAFSISFIEQLIEILIKENTYHSYLNTICIITETTRQIKAGNVYCEYVGMEKTIYIYLKVFKDWAQTDYRIELLSDIEKTMYQNLTLVQSLLHELEHIKQFEIAYTNSNIEADILQCSLNLIKFYSVLKDMGYNRMDALKLSLAKKKKVSKNYDNNYFIAPEERLAEIRSYQQIKEMLEYLKDDMPRLYLLAEIQSLQAHLKGFEKKGRKLLSPTTSYLIKNGDRPILNTYDWYSSIPEQYFEIVRERYSLKERIEYGLPIHIKELQKPKEILKEKKKALYEKVIK